MKQVRLSMKLLWKIAGDYAVSDSRKYLSAMDFLEFAEKSPRYTTVHQTTTKQKSRTKKTS